MVSHSYLNKLTVLMMSRSQIPEGSTSLGYTCSLASFVLALWAKISRIRPILSSTGIPHDACRFLDWTPLSSVFTITLFKQNK